jgi:hypothetical protein
MGSVLICGGRMVKENLAQSIDLLPFRKGTQIVVGVSLRVSISSCMLYAFSYISPTNCVKVKIKYFLYKP